MGRARDISKVFSTGTALATDTEVSGSYLTLASASTTYQTKATAGLTLLTPASIANTGGTASIGANGTVSFTSASAISLNDVFSATYTNYQIVIECDGSTSAQIRMRLRASGSDLTSGYNAEMKFSAFGSNSNTFNENANATDIWILGLTPSGGDGRFSSSVNICNPFASKAKTINGLSTGTKGGAYRGFAIFGGDVGGTTSYPGFTIYPASGNITGTLSVYGYNK
jgi:hypothetical protein